MKTARSRAATTYTWYLGPQTCTSEASSQTDGPAPSTRAWMERSAARGMLSCRPAHAACRSERRPAGSRWSNAPTCRRNARISARVTRSRALVMARSVTLADGRQRVRLARRRERLGARRGDAPIFARVSPSRCRRGRTRGGSSTTSSASCGSTARRGRTGHDDAAVAQARARAGSPGVVRRRSSGLGAGGSSRRSRPRRAAGARRRRGRVLHVGRPVAGTPARPCPEDLPCRRSLGCLAPARRRTRERHHRHHRSGPCTRARRRRRQGRGDRRQLVEARFVWRLANRTTAPIQSQ